MKKILINIFIIIIIALITLIGVLSTVGIETNKFNKLISDKVTKTKKIDLDLDRIKFKINLKALSLFLETEYPKITFRNQVVPVQNIKVYGNFISLLKSDPEIKKISFVLEELDIKQLNKLSLMIKPSNLKSILNNRIKEGKLISEVEIFLTKKGNLKNFIAKGIVKELKLELFSDLMLDKINLSFFADKNDVLIQNIFGNLGDIKLSNGDLKLNLENGIKINSNFDSEINFDEKLLSKYNRFFKKYNFINDIKSLKTNLSNNLFIYLDNTYKVKDYNYNISGKIKKGKFELSNPIKSTFIQEEIKEIYLSDLKVKTAFDKNKTQFISEGKYSFNNTDFMKIHLENNFKNDVANLELNFDFGNIIELELINYKKSKDTIANLSLNIEKRKNNIKIEKLDYQEGKNLIKINSLDLSEKKYLSFKKIEVVTKNNDFFVENNKKILIKGNKFDATNLAKFIGSKGGENKLKNLNGELEIDFNNIKVPMSEKLKNFKLIGEIKKGKFIKISSKGDFGGNNFLDISMRKDVGSDKKYLEIYSDLTRPMLAEYSFFNGLSGGKLLFTSIIDNSKSYSKLKIEDFKVINAPGVIKLLSLADLGGLVDLAEGEGLSFDVLEIDMEKDKSLLTLNEILALGPSMSVLMEGYKEENGLTSLRGTLVPAKTLNKMISKIPVIGNIVIPKEVGEGLFGISFKMKGPKGKIKTSINPIRTLTPRFIQKIIDRNKSAK